MKNHKKIIADAVFAAVKEYAAGAGAEFLAGAEDILSEMTVPPDEALGDYAYPCFRWAKAFRKNPNVIAADICANVMQNPEVAAVCAGAETAGAYINFRLRRPEFITGVLNGVAAAGAGYGASGEGAGKTVCIDYSSVNIAKPFHMGHLSNTVIGGSLYRIYKFLGYRVVGINYLGDYGTQFGNLIAAYKKWGSEEDLKNRGVNSLLDLYVRFHAEAKERPEYADEGRAWFKAIEDKDPEALRIFGLFKEITLKEVKGVYDELGVTFDNWDGESFYTDKIAAVVDELKSKNLLNLSEGAYVVDLEKYNLPPALILRSDGASLYITRDIAAACHRKKVFDFDKSLYVVAYQQNLHFKQLFAVLELMGKEWVKDCVHVAYGMVSMADGAMSTREGKVVFLKDVLARAKEKTLEIINAKNPDLENKEAVSAKVGVGAVVYSALSGGKIKDIVFDYDKVLNFEGETGPYLMYTHARACSVLARADGFKAGALTDAEAAVLNCGEAFTLCKLINKFPETVADAARDFEPSYITRLLIDTAQAFNKFYFEHKIITGNAVESAARLKLTAITRDLLKKGMELILIDAPEKM